MGQLFRSSNDLVLHAGDGSEKQVGDLIFKTSGVERARITHDGTGSGWANVLGGSLPLVLASISRDASGRPTAWTYGGTSFVATYSASSGLITTQTANGVTRTYSRDASGQLTGVS